MNPYLMSFIFWVTLTFSIVFSLFLSFFFSGYYRASSKLNALLPEDSRHKKFQADKAVASVLVVVYSVVLSLILYNMINFILYEMGITKAVQ